MAVHIVRFVQNIQTQWGLIDGTRILPLDIACTTTADLIALGLAGLAAARRLPPLPADQVTLLSPITRHAKVLCQGANYRQHMIDSGMDPDAKRFNMFFTKSSASITGPVGKIVKPGHVSLLDYEIELTLVLRQTTTGPLQVNERNLHEYVAGICIANDISARDIQIPQMQFHKGKSYRTFCPLGPVLCLLEPDEMHYLNSLQLTLKVNGGIRQQDSTANLVYKPAETLTEMSQITDFEPGDVLLTGTPSGCALGLPSAAVVRFSALLPEATKWRLFLKSQHKRSQYLKVGDKIESRIVSQDGRLDLGCQQHVIA